MKMYSEDKKRFNKPELEIVEFGIEDIIVTSNGNGGDFGNPDPEKGDINIRGWW